MRGIANAIVMIAAVALGAPLLVAAPTSHVEARDYSSAPRIAGPAKVIDGDTIEVGGRRVRLFGIDAPEGRQQCDDGWEAGEQARRVLASMLPSSAVVQCEQKDTDRYGRAVAICRQGEIDVGEQMVRAGQAWAYTKYSARYVGAEDEARRAGRGIHRPGRTCETPWKWRAHKRVTLA